MIMNKQPNCRTFLEEQAKMISEAVMKLVEVQLEQQGPLVQLILLRKLMNPLTIPTVPRIQME